MRESASLYEFKENLEVGEKINLNVLCVKELLIEGCRRMALAMKINNISDNLAKRVNLRISKEKGRLLILKSFFVFIFKKS
jgi:hypothetical protein